MPFLSNIKTIEQGDVNSYPYTIPVYKNGLNLTFNSNVTFFVGENGSGKSTLLEAIGAQCGFNLAGGSKDHSYISDQTASELASNLRLSWSPRRIHQGFYMRAESFFNFATYIDEIAKEEPSTLATYGGKSLHEQSHGESFLALFTNRFDKGIYILDEPEAALSPKRQLSFMALIHELEKSGKAQFLIATHSPILLTYPGATIYSFDSGVIESVTYDQTDHYQLTRRFLEAPDKYLKHLLGE